jgi:hypothetical protein
VKVLTIKNEGNYSDAENYAIDKDGRGIKKISVFKSGFNFESLKLVEATSSDSRRSTGISSGAISGSNYISFFEVEPAHFTLMNVPTVVPARGWRGEGLNFPFIAFSIKGHDTHRVSGFDFFDLMPSNFVATEWVYYHDSFVIKDDRGMQEDLIGDSRSEKTPNGCDHAAGKSIVKEINIGERSEEKKSQVGEDVRALGSEELAIAHEEIFSCKREMEAA